MNSSDWNSEAAFETAMDSRVALDANVYGYADSASVESIPGPEGNELLVLFRAEKGHSGRDGQDFDHAKFAELLAAART